MSHPGLRIGWWIKLVELQLIFQAIYCIIKIELIE